jgi:hypothetical protein
MDLSGWKYCPDSLLGIVSVHVCMCIYVCVFVFLVGGEIDSWICRNTPDVCGVCMCVCV